MTLDDFEIPVTVSPELNPLPDIAYQSDVYGFPTQVSNTFESTNVDAPSGGILGTITKTANDLLNFYGKVVSIEAQSDSARFNREITKANAELAKTKAIGAVDIAKAQTDASVTISKAQADAAKSAAIEQSRIAQAGGAVAYVKKSATENWQLWIALAGLAFAVYQFKAGKS